MKLIQTITLTSSQSSIQLTSIPQDATDLLVLFSIRSDRVLGSETCVITVNGTSVTRRYLRAIGGGSVSSGTDFDFTVSAAQASANTFGNGSLYLPNYSLTTINKTISSDSVTANNADSFTVLFSASRYASNSAVTSLTLAPITGPNFIAGSTVSLYLITKGSDGIVTTTP